MTDVQLDIWSLAPTHRDDPSTSARAAAKVKAQTQYVMVLRCLYDAERPLTDDEIGERCGIPARPDAGTRRGVAMKQGYVVKAGEGVSARGNACAAWALTADGKAYVEGLA